MTFIERFVHTPNPLVAFDSANRKRYVPHPQAGVTKFFNRPLAKVSIG